MILACSAGNSSSHTVSRSNRSSVTSCSVMPASSCFAFAQVMASRSWRPGHGDHLSSRTSILLDAVALSHSRLIGFDALNLQREEWAQAEPSPTLQLPQISSLPRPA
jgi:hypothetical protein